MIPRDVIQRIKDQSDIVDVVSETVQLRRAGKAFKGLCPFHDDHDPSMMVNPARQSFKCWVCNTGGSVVDFVMARDGLPFADAVKLLGDRVGIKVETEPPRPKRPGEVDRDDLLRVNEWARDFFQARFAGSPAESAMLERGFTAETLQAFGVGYAPNRWETLWTEGRRHFHGNALIQAGLVQVKERDDGSTSQYDNFRHRIMFPIGDRRGRVIGFGGRRLDEEDPRKYINTAETPVYQKSRVLFGLHQALPKIREFSTAVIMEGYTDVMMAHQFGLTNAIAACGTALTAEHMTTLHGADHVVLVFDGDTAGLNAAERVLPQVLASGKDAHIVTLPSGQDPADLLLKEGVAALVEAMEAGLTPLEFKLKALRTKFDWSNAAQKTAAVSECAQLVAAAATPVLRNVLIQQTAQAFRLADDVIAGEVAKVKRRQERPWERERPSLSESRDANNHALEAINRHLEAVVLATALGDRELAPEVFEAFPPEWFRQDGYRQIAREILRLVMSERPWDYADVLLGLDDAGRALCQRIVDTVLGRSFLEDGRPDAEENEADLSFLAGRDDTDINGLHNFPRLLRACIDARDRRDVTRSLKAHRDIVRGRTLSTDNLARRYDRLSVEGAARRAEETGEDAPPPPASGPEIADDPAAPDVVERMRLLELQKLKDRKSTSRRVRADRKFQA